MPLDSESYPALLERALRLIETRGEPIREGELAHQLFGAPAAGLAAGGPWSRLLTQVLGTDERLRRLPDGRWATPRVDGSGDDAASSRQEPVGLVVLATGPKPWRHHIVALGAARWGRGSAPERFETLVRPAERCRVPAYLARFGVNAPELDEAPDLGRAIDDLLSFVGRAPLAGLDVGLAVARLQFALRQLGRVPLDNPLVELAQPGDERPDLQRLARSHGMRLPSAPRPGALAAAAAQLARGQTVPWERSSDSLRVTEGTRVDVAEWRGGEDAAPSNGPPGHARLREDRVAYTAASALDSTAWRRLLDARELETVPDDPGVYLFRDRRGRLLYVGKATSLRSRLGSYLTGNFPLQRTMPGLVEATAKLEWEELSCELAARVREAELIALHRPAYNVQRAYGPPLVRARLVLAGEPKPSGPRVPRLALGLDGGVLTTRSAAREALSRARRGWWPARPRVGARPSAADVRERLAVVARRAEADMRAAVVAGTLRAGDLASLMVVTPVRPRGGSGGGAAVVGEVDGDGWVRERGGADLGSFGGGARSPSRPHPSPLPEGAGTMSEQPRGYWMGALAKPGTDRGLDAGDRSLAALLFDEGGLRAATVLEDGPEDEVGLRAAATGALSEAPRREASTGPGALTQLSVLIAALRRGEPGLWAWPAG